EVGVTATVIEPGLFRTDFLDSSSIRFTAGPHIDDYVHTVETAMERYRQLSGKQPGDPNKAAAAILQIASAAEPPVRLPLGVDAIERVERKLKAVAAELDRWRALGEATAYADETPGEKAAVHY